MHDVGTVQVVQSAQQIVAESHYVLLAERVRLQLAEYRVQVQVDALHHEEHIVEIFVKTVGCFPRWDENVN